MSRPAALVLTGDLGIGHHMVSQVVAEGLERRGWHTDLLDCMTLLGPLASRAGAWVFHCLTAIPSLYDATYFSHLRTGSRLAGAMDRAATARSGTGPGRPPGGDAGGPGGGDLCHRSVGHRPGRRQQPDDAPSRPRRWRSVPTSYLTDCGFTTAWTSLWSRLRRRPRRCAAHAPRLPVAILPSPVRAAFYQVPGQAQARTVLGMAPDARCVLLMGGGWGLGPLVETAGALADRGVTVLAVAGHNRRSASADATGPDRLGFTDNPAAHGRR